MTSIATPRAPTTRGRRVAVAAAAATFTFGFLGMALYSLTGPAFGPLPTVWQSWGGTVGDIALPLVVYGLIRGVQTLGPDRIHVGSWFAGMAGSLGGMASQAAWLLDPEPYINWMLVAPHTFSPIGWYHFAYLVVLSGFVAGTAWELLVRARRTRLRAGGLAVQDHRLQLVFASRATTWTTTAVLLFAATVAADSVTSLDSIASVGTIGGALVPLLIAFLVTTAMLGSCTRLLIRPLATAAGTVAVLVAAVVVTVHLG